MKLACAATVIAATAGLAVTASASTTTNSTTTVLRSSDRYSAVIRRTDFGIPHILASDFGDLGYGYGYAFAQDNLCSLADLVVTADGQRSQFFGPDGKDDNPLDGNVSNLDSDVYHRWENNSGIVRRTLGQPAPLGMTPQVRQILNGYVAGVNRYLATTGVANLPDPTCRAMPWVHPITAVEMERIIYNVNQFDALDDVQPQIAEAVPAAVAANKPLALPNLNPTDAGSNGIAVGRTGTQHGDGILLANPHFPWQNAGRFYQVQFTIPGTLNVTGGSLFGTPVIEIGHNQNVAWTHTVSTAQRFTLYQLKLVPGDPTSYLVDGKPEKMVPHTVTVPQNDGTTVTRTIYTSRYGPLLNIGWTATSAIAIRGASADNGRSANEWLAMGEANSISALRAAQNRYQGIPFTNTIATDDTGTAFFADNSVVPNVTDAEAARCVDSPEGQAMLPDIYLLDGSTSGCAWGDSPDAITPGIFGPSTNPTLTRTDFVTNSNDSSWLTNPAAPITNVPPVYGTVDTERSPRTRLGIQLIDGRLAGTDGLGAPKFSVSTMQRMEFGEQNFSAEVTRDDAVALCRANPTLTATDGTTVDVRSACAALAAWNLRDDLTSQGAVLWRQFWANAIQAPDLWQVPFDAAHPLTTPNTLNTASAGVSQALADAVERLNALHVPVNAPLSAAQVTDVTGTPLAVPGCGDLEGCYSVVDSQDDSQLHDNGQFGPIVFGSSFMMVADMSKQGPTARTILTYSESANPNSPHHGDQTKLFAKKQWVTDRFSAHDIAADPQLTTTVLSGR
jgi:acyl-homoserine-lactone acylase